MEIQRKFFLGDEWLYYKIYLGEYVSDFVLTDIVYVISKQLIDNKIIDKFFFIRYQDSEGYHIRIRLHIIDIKNINIVINTFNSLIRETFNKNMINKIQADTYERELERYYGECISYSENIFYIDSLTILNFLSILHQNNLPEYFRWLFGIYSIDSFMINFEIDLKQRLEIAELLNSSFYKEFGVDKYLVRQLDEKYRTEKDEIYQVLNNKNKDFFALINFRSIHMSKNIENIKSKLSNTQIKEILISFIHMSCNRLFRSNQRKHEFVLYHFLWKYYRNEVGKVKYKK